VDLLENEEAIMASKRSTKAKRASTSYPAELRARTHVPHPTGDPNADGPISAPSSVAPPIDTTAEAAGRPAQRAAIEQAMARQNVRLTRSPGAIGPIGRTVLLIALIALVGLIAVWLLLVI
jgi:hypothetical protein